MSRWFSVLVLFILVIFQVITMAPVSAAVVDRVLINEVRLGGPEVQFNGKTVKEYVTFVNNGDTEVSLDGWVLEYAKNAKPGLDDQFCAANTWSGFSSITVSSVRLDGTIAPGNTSAPLEIQLNDSGSGSLRLLDVSDPDAVTVQDMLGWGPDAPCKEASPAEVPTSGKSLFRKLDCETKLPIDGDDNGQDFVSNQDSAPGELGTVFDDECDEPVVNEKCDEVAITEVLPNPKGTDTGSEFIELHNLTDVVLPLDGCGLATSDGKEYMFKKEAKLEPGEYKAFYDSETGLTLVNSKSVTLMIVSSTMEIPIQAYPADLREGIAWALISSSWQQTNNPTPGAPNIPMTPVDAAGKGSAEGLAPCPAGKFRNPLTNRCKSIVLATNALTPCKPGQVRNPSTNRCRSATLAASSLTPCKPGQERNPATNRCRRVLSAGSSLKPCKEGEERNPETNRCRKAAAKLASANIDDKQNSGRSAVSYGVVGLVGSSVIGYGLYEYRNDLRNKLANLKSRFTPDKSGE